ncbi:unnamed protein product (macronuclear) [Paramecium tetraurelia]|uniref:Arrestin-like N-terminal domain-containing protein n=1 Tax=Paramecium tetraurelia TaxID=5888 RepID=A0BU24_PARTE|nr:uncharacterized protein GSPATT00032273001 [Paramecium tetraurelia]CAK62041.1 unnamed protein product [Paramecium tetraurelia]|eukprot:XP_001429439.1 hypothetical protein (macronuclear) [Paramecium tetraurelia strain d4-2]
MSSGHKFNKSNKLRAQITFQNNLYYEGEVITHQEVHSIEGQGTLFTDKSKFQIIFEGSWRNNSFHGTTTSIRLKLLMIGILIGRQLKVQITFQTQAIFNMNDIIEGKVDFYQKEDVIADKIGHLK